MMNRILFFLFLLINTSSFAQEDSIFDRLRAIQNTNQFTYYVIGGVSITSEDFLFSFNEDILSIAYRTYNVSDEKKAKDELLKYNNYVVRTSVLITDDLFEYNSYYFVENKEGKVLIILFGSNNKSDEDFERSFIELVVENKIPESCFSDQASDTINFASRDIPLDGNCNYMNVNSVQCPYRGQINWSIHKNLADAKRTNVYQLKKTLSKELGEVVFDDYVDVVFEGIATKARKLVFDFSNNPEFVKATSNAKSMTIYYVAVKIRGHIIGCVLSHWDNDKIGKSGLPYLLNELMTLK